MISFETLECAVEWVREHKKITATCIAILIIFFVWYKFPNPNSIEISPWNMFNYGEDLVKSEKKISANLAEANLGFSVTSEISSLLLSMSTIADYAELAGTMKDICDTAENTKDKQMTIVIPQGAGCIGDSSIAEIYNWKKTYRRFFSKELITECNLLFIMNGQVIWLYFGGDGIQSIDLSLKYGI